MLCPILFVGHHLKLYMQLGQLYESPSASEVTLNDMGCLSTMKFNKPEN